MARCATSVARSGTRDEGNGVGQAWRDQEHTMKDIRAPSIHSPSKRASKLCMPYGMDAAACNACVRVRACVRNSGHAFHLIVVSESAVNVRVAQLKSKECGIIRLGLVVLPRAAYGAVQRARDWWWRGEHACGDANDIA